jgi:hypothetical protein
MYIIGMEKIVVTHSLTLVTFVVLSFVHIRGGRGMKL